MPVANRDSILLIIVLFLLDSSFLSVALKQKSFCVLPQYSSCETFQTCSPSLTTESKCFAENWICATVPQEIDHNSKSIYPTHKYTRDISQNVKLAFNFLLDFKVVESLQGFCKVPL